MLMCPVQQEVGHCHILHGSYQEDRSMTITRQ
jgi:hypothetical protein